MLLTQPLFLLGLLAVGIPIAIHLLQLRRYKKVYFSNVDMLEELHSEDRRQRNLRNLLVLLCRILCIVFLVLAFCKPVLPHRAAQVETGAAAVSVYIDNSYSMECGGMDDSLIESARRKAREIAAAYQPGDQFQLLTNDLAGGQFRWLSRDEFLTAVDEVGVSAVTQQLSRAAARQNEFLRSARSANRHAYIISDFQRSTADVAALEPDSLVSATFIPLGGTDVANIYIDSLAFDSPAYCPGAAVRVRAFVRNDGDHAVESLPLRLVANGRQRSLASVSLPAHGTVPASMVFALDDSPLLQGYVETTDYPITFDDRFYFSLSVTRRVPLTVIGGSSENASLRRLFQGDTLVEYRYAPVSQIDYARLSDNRLVIIDELRAIPSGLARQLQDFVVAGGSLLVVPAQDADLPSYNQLLAAMQAPRLDSWVPRAVRADRVEDNARLYQGVFRGAHDDMELPAVHGHYRLAMPAGTVAQPLIRLADGGLYLLSVPVGEGVCYLFAAPLREECTDFVRQALFVPTLYNMALFSTRVPPPCHLLTDLDPIPLSQRYAPDSPPRLTAAIVQDSAAAVEAIPDIRRIGSACCLVPHGEVSQAGCYTLAADGQPPEGLAFNCSRRESDLASYTPAELKSLLRRGAGGAKPEVVASAQKSLTDHIRQQSQGTPLWRWCLLLALLALAAETILIRTNPERCI